ncbi:hypothetical protein AB4Z46_08235 [Variovorax sp. M-6]|uniref:hypothetical protein n=1 Tax=Variovorax sp. M-6 TaxID=3233041 RepID=UPI003F957B47
MNKSSRSITIVIVTAMVVIAGGWPGRGNASELAAAEGKVLDLAAAEVIKKFEGASCEQLKARQEEPPTMARKAAIALLRKHEKARVAFIDRIAAPVLNKMIECGMAP